MDASAACILAGAAAGAAATAIVCSSAGARRPPAAAPPEVWELKGEYYQVLGHAWDHEVKDFKVCYRPLYHCVAAAGRFEGHVLACSHYSRWESKFRRLKGATVSEIESQLPAAAAALLLRGPFVHDPRWAYDTAVLPTGAPPGATRSGFGTRSHEPVLLEHLLGDYRGFIDALVDGLGAAGLDVRAKGYELDHICYRCSSVAQYRKLCAALIPRLGTLAVEGKQQRASAAAHSAIFDQRPKFSTQAVDAVAFGPPHSVHFPSGMIGGRPIATVRLNEPIKHGGFIVSCIEVPCPKPGRHYAAGLE
jgi:hypothetical protein